jgi:hypothetical protein
VLLYATAWFKELTEIKQQQINAHTLQVATEKPI